MKRKGCDTVYESKYRKYVTKSQACFADGEEIIAASSPLEQTAGAPVYYSGGKCYVDGSDTHTLIVGPTGCKKSRIIARNTLASIIENGESAIVNDPKGELEKTTYIRAKKLGYKTIILNFREPEKSHGWNPLKGVYDSYEKGDISAAEQYCEDIASAIMGNVRNTEDPYWEEVAGAYFKAVIKALAASDSRGKYVNLKTLIPLCSEMNSGNLARVSDKMDPMSPVRNDLQAVLGIAAEKTRSCVFSTLFAALSSLIKNESLINLLSRTSFDIESIGMEKTIVYVIYPDEKKSCDKIVNLFFTQCYEILVAKCVTLPENRLPVRVNMLYDEFSNLTPVVNFDNRISEARSKNIRYFLFVQSCHQLAEKYGECAETIMSNCGNWIIFSNREMSLLQKISAVCGNEVDYNGAEHPIITPYDMQFLEKRNDSADVLIIRAGLKPYVTALPDFYYTEISSLYKESSLYSVNAEDYEAAIISPTAWSLSCEAERAGFSLPFKSGYSAMYKKRYTEWKKKSRSGMFREGEYILHPQFGTGLIVTVNGAEDNIWVAVDFEGVRRKFSGPVLAQIIA